MENVTFTKIGILNRPYKIHFVKCLDFYFERLQRGEKTLELRLNDRDYQVGDLLYTREYNHKTQTLTGEGLLFIISHTVDNPQFGLLPGYIALSIHPYLGEVDSLFAKQFVSRGGNSFFESIETQTETKEDEVL